MLQCIKKTIFFYLFYISSKKLKNFDKFSIMPSFLIKAALEAYQFKENAKAAIQPYLEDKIIPIVQIALIKYTVIFWLILNLFLEHIQSI
jgi:hypothetical protein